MEVEAEAADGVTRSRVWRSAEPFDTRALAERVWWQLRAWIETGGITDGLTRLKLSPTGLSDEGYQPDLFEQREVRIETERALERTRTILGPDSVLRARPQGGRDPAERVQWARWGEDFAEPTRSPASPWPGRVPAPSPSLVPSRPRRLEVEWDAEAPTRVRLSTRWEPVLAWAGPWRRLGEWWGRGGTGVPCTRSSPRPGRCCAGRPGAGLSWWASMTERVTSPDSPHFVLRKPLGTRWGCQAGRRLEAGERRS